MREICIIVVLLVGYAASDILMAICEIQASTGKADYPLEGKITFSQESGQNVSIDIVLQGFNTTDDEDKHGFHVHAEGMLTDGCKDAGGHFNPAGVDHGAPWDEVRHVGDLGNIMEGDDGSIMHSFTDHIIQLEGNYSIIGKSIVVHETEDDLGLGGHSDSKTTGHAGARLGCCIIESVEDTSGMGSGTPSGDIMTSGSDSGSGSTTPLGNENIVQDDDDDDNGGITVTSVNLALLLVCGLICWFQ